MANNGLKPVKPKSGDLQLVRHGQKERATVTITLEVDRDDDIIAEVNKIDKKKRQERIRNALRAGLDNLEPEPIADRGELEAILGRFEVSLKSILEYVEWMGGFLEKLHLFIDDKFSKIGSGVSSRPATKKTEEAGKMSDEAKKRIMQNTGDADF